MEKFVINGSKRLVGEVEISGAKNAAVAVIPATLLCSGVCRITNVPEISDVNMMIKTLDYLGAKITYINRHTVEIDTSSVRHYSVPYEYTKYLRASYYFIGALLGRFKRAKVAMPGGCNFGGVRPIDQHIKGFEAIGAKVNLGSGGVVDAKADELVGDSVYMDVISVGATMNTMLAATLAKGKTVIENAAKEPHIVDLANFLNMMGADVRGAGTDVIKIYGVSELHGCEYSVIPDQIEAGTYMVAAAATGGDVTIKNVIPKHLESISAKLIETGVTVIEGDDQVRVVSEEKLKCTNIKTMPHPGFPTDMQPQFGALLAICDGTGIITESVWDNRFKYANQLLRMGAQIDVNGKVAVFKGVDHLKGAPLYVDDLRAGAAMVIAGLSAKGETIISNIQYIDRGYEDIVSKLQHLGADICRRDFDDEKNEDIIAG
ncbi:MAG: UDP-N-acetylglucosamine 1-carboxyvinyltransferase [Clostridia bacterium]|nr:UDP-N-acetylglucosamine 1-carboxyvinyltransferase [Clostridia bacterium]